MNLEYLAGREATRGFLTATATGASGEFKTGVDMFKR